MANTRRGYAVPLDRMVRDFGADTNTATLDPDRVAGWFAFAWGGCSAKTFNTRLTVLGSACAYWRAQEWLTGDPLVWLRTRADAAGPRECVEHRAGRDDPRVGLRHSGLRHAAEQRASTPMLMALFRHTSVRSLAKYARVLAEALGKWQAQRDPAARRTGGAR